MRVQIHDYFDVAARARALGCPVPGRVALLPGNFSTAANTSEFCFHAITPYVRAAWQSIGFEDEGPDPARGTLGENGDCTVAQPMLCSEGLSPFSRPQAGRGIQTPAPGPQSLAPSPSADIPLVVYFGPDLLDGPPWRLPVALGLVSSVLATHYRRTGPRVVRLDVVVGRSGNCACIEYQGDAFGIVALTREVRRVWSDK